MSEELTHRTSAVCAALINLSSECCGMSHHYTWRHNGHELPLCGSGRPEMLMGCAHGNNLSLRAAVVLVSDLGLINSAEKSQLISFLNVARDNLWLIDLDAIDASTNVRTDMKRQIAINLKADPDLPETIELALHREQKQVVDSLDLLRNALLMAIKDSTPNLKLLKNFIRVIQKDLKLIQNFELDHQKFRTEVLGSDVISD